MRFFLASRYQHTKGQITQIKLNETVKISDKPARLLHEQTLRTPEVEFEMGSLRVMTK